MMVYFTHHQQWAFVAMNISILTADILHFLAQHKMHFLSFMGGAFAPGGYLLSGQHGSHGVITKGQDRFCIPVTAELLGDPALLDLFTIGNGNGLCGALGNGVGPFAITIADACHSVCLADLKLFHFFNPHNIG